MLASRNNARASGQMLKEDPHFLSSLHPIIASFCMVGPSASQQQWLFKCTAYMPQLGQ